MPGTYIVHVDYRVGKGELWCWLEWSRCLQAKKPQRLCALYDFSEIDEFWLACDNIHSISQDLQLFGQRETGSTSHIHQELVSRNGAWLNYPKKRQRRPKKWKVWQRIEDRLLRLCECEGSASWILISPRGLGFLPNANFGVLLHLMRILPDQAIATQERQIRLWKQSPYPEWIDVSAGDVGLVKLKLPITSSIQARYEDVKSDKEGRWIDLVPIRPCFGDRSIPFWLYKGDLSVDGSVKTLREFVSFKKPASICGPDEE